MKRESSGLLVFKNSQCLVILRYQSIDSDPQLRTMTKSTLFLPSLFTRRPWVVDPITEGHSSFSSCSYLWLFLHLVQREVSADTKDATKEDLPET